MLVHYSNSPQIIPEFQLTSILGNVECFICWLLVNSLPVQQADATHQPSIYKLCTFITVIEHDIKIQ